MGIKTLVHAVGTVLTFGVLAGRVVLAAPQAAPGANGSAPTDLNPLVVADIDALTDSDSGGG